MIEALISSKTRIKLLLKFFLNSETEAYLRSLASEFGESSNAIRIELNRFEKAGMLRAELRGNKKVFRANIAHPLFVEIHNILKKQIGLDKIIENVVERLGDVNKVYLTGRFAAGMNSDVIDLIFIGAVNEDYLLQLIEKVEQVISRKVQYSLYLSEEAEKLNEILSFQTKPLLLWSKD